MTSTHWLHKEFEELSTIELYDIMNLRQTVFVVEQNAAYLDADGKDFNAIHVFTYIKNSLASYARVLPPGVSYREASIGRVVTLPKYRKKGLAKKLMEQCLGVLNNTFKTDSCRISAQTYLVPFYSSFGFEVCSKEYLEDGLPHFEMLRLKN